MVDGAFAGEPGKCFIAVYTLPWASTVNNAYYFGAPFFHDYYVSFSMESYYNSKAEYLQMAVGPICKTAHLGDIIYNKDYKYYDPASLTNDTSTAIPDAKFILAKDLDNSCVPVPPDPE